jgi:pimeloyl-ACP methyl ester carboxylesterase
MSRISTYTRDDLVFDVLDEGPADGEAIVLLHGFPERASSWRLVAPLLHRHGYRTIAPDQRGYSPGARPAHRRDYRIGELVDDVVALIEQVGGPVHLVGHDWGAAVGWAVAARHPDLVRSWTAFSVPHTAAYTKALLGRQGLKSWYMALFNLPWLPETLGAAGRLDPFLRHTGWGEAELARFREEIVAYGALPGGLGWYRAMPYALREPVGRVRVPTTMVWSDGDTAVDRRGPELTAGYCKGPYEYVELRGVTHWIPTEAPEAAAEAILERVVSA